MRGDGTVTKPFSRPVPRRRSTANLDPREENRRIEGTATLDRSGSFQFRYNDALTRTNRIFFPGSLDHGDPVIWCSGHILIGNSVFSCAFVSVIGEVGEDLSRPEKRKGRIYSKREIWKRQYEDLLLFFGGRTVSTGELILFYRESLLMDV